MWIVGAHEQDLPARRPAFLLRPGALWSRSRLSVSGSRWTGGEGLPGSPLCLCGQATEEAWSLHPGQPLAGAFSPRPAEWEVKPPHRSGDPVSQLPGLRVAGVASFPEHPCHLETFSASRTQPLSLGTRDSAPPCPAVRAAPGPAPGTTVSVPDLLTDFAFLGLSLLICTMGVRAAPPSGAARSPNQSHSG